MLISQCESNILCTYLHNEINLAEVYTGLKKYPSVTKANTSEIMWDDSVCQKVLNKYHCKNTAIVAPE